MHVPSYKFAVMARGSRVKVYAFIYISLWVVVEVFWEL